MWSIAVLVVLMMVTGLYTVSHEANVPTGLQSSANTLAASMATYRSAVVSYFSQNPDQYQSVSIDTLKSAGVLPTWSTLYTQPATSKWANYRDPATGIIYIYAGTPLDTNITAEVAALSQNSILAGVFRSGDTTLFSPLFGNTGIALPSPASVAIPNGSPLWIAFRH
jgi:hypothetical protein